MQNQSVRTQKDTDHMCDRQMNNKYDRTKSLASNAAWQKVN